METTFLSITREKPITSNQDIVKIVDKELQNEQFTIYLPFTIEDIEMLRKTKKNKTAGLDEIPAEIWKTGHITSITYY